MITRCFKDNRMIRLCQKSAISQSVAFSSRSGSSAISTHPPNPKQRGSAWLLRPSCFRLSVGTVRHHWAEAWRVKMTPPCLCLFYLSKLINLEWLYIDKGCLKCHWNDNICTVNAARGLQRPGDKRRHRGARTPRCIPAPDFKHT